jgi:hypothetical protein
MPAQHVPDRLGGDVVFEIGQSAGDPAVAAAGVLTRHLHDQLFYLRINLWPPRARTGALNHRTLLRHQPRIVSGFATCAAFARPLSPESFPDLAQSGAFGIGEPQPRWGVRPPDSVLGGEIFDLQQQFLIHQPRHLCQQPGHLVACFHPACIFSGALILNQF